MSLPFVKGSETSEAAALSKAGTADTDEDRVQAYIRTRGVEGATDDEIEAKLGMLHQNASARRRTLVLRGYVRDSGLRRATRSRRKAVVWIAVDGLPVQPQKAPTKSQLCDAVEAMRAAWSRGVPFTPGAIVTMRWLAKRAGVELPPP
jgi:hypothetical protein